MRLKLVKSTNIHSVGYDPQAKILKIKFRDGGIYNYYQVPSWIFKELLDAESCGTYFHQFIRNNYPYKKIM